MNVEKVPGWEIVVITYVCTFFQVCVMINMGVVCFDWDQGNVAKIKQRFNLEEVEEFFSQEILVIEDKIHSSDEKRFIATGLGPKNKPMFVCFTMNPGNMKNSKKNTKNKAPSNADPLNGDLSSLFSSPDWKKIKFELKPKNKSITIRISEEMLSAIKAKAQDEGLDYQKWIRSSIEDALNKTA